MNAVSMLHERGSASDGLSHAALLAAALPALVPARAEAGRIPAALASAPADPDPVEHAIARLLTRHAAEAERTDDPAGPTPERALPPSGTALYETAGRALTDGRIAEALVLLADAVATPEHRANALLGLAVCAVRLKCFDEGLILALESRGSGPGHPRASHVAGLCELERGNRRAAQAHLATAARLARRAPELREDLQLAQRTLLLMHLT